VPKKFDLEDRLVEYSSGVMQLIEMLPSTKAGNHIAGQLIRCGTAPALHYGEAQSAESREDFIHKMKIALKELKETRICLKLIVKNRMAESVEDISRENEELIAIFYTSIETAKRNKSAKP
jgi:four helix bundle protein